VSQWREPGPSSRYWNRELLRTGRKSVRGHESRYILRADLVDSLYEAAIRDDVQVDFDAVVTDIDGEGPAVVLRDGRMMRSDVLIGDDDLRPLAREPGAMAKFYTQVYDHGRGDQYSSTPTHRHTSHEM
jgi:hypothetical protein